MRILVLDDDCGEAIEELLVKVGHEVQIVADGDEAFKLYCDNGPFDIVLTDIDHPGMSAVDFQKAIFARNPKQSFALVTAYRVLQKPFLKEELYQLVDEMKPEGGTAQIQRSVKKIDAVIKSLSKKPSKPN
jgi:DNA-binding NtrC family response regulator